MRHEYISKIGDLMNIFKKRYGTTMHDVQCEFIESVLARSSELCEFMKILDKDVSIKIYPDFGDTTEVSLSMNILTPNGHDTPEDHNRNNVESINICI